MFKRFIKLDKLVSSARKLFPIDWLDRYDWEHLTEQELVLFYDKINKYAEEAFIEIAKSILSGEYLIRPNIIDVLDKLQDNFCQEPPVDRTNLYKSNIWDSYEEVSSLLRYNIKRYKQFIARLDNRYAHSIPRFIFSEFTKSSHKGKNHQMADYFDVLFDIVGFDYMLSVDKESIRTLILHHSRINDLAESSFDDELKRVLGVLDQKALFLLKKLMIEGTNEFDYLIESKLQHFNTSSCRIGFFSDFDTSFEFYRRKEYTEDSFVRDLYQKSSEGKLRIGQMALLMKCYKDLSDTTLIQIDNLIKDFDKKFEKLFKQHNSRKYDTYALRTLKNYMYNCRLSYKISKTDYKFEFLENDMQEIMNIQKATRIMNFYPYQKAIEFIITIVEKDKELSRQTVESYLSRMDFYIRKCEEAINWCEEQHFIPIQNVYNESLSKVDGFGVVLVPSTFCRPINYDKRRHILSAHKTHALFLRNELSLREEREEIRAIQQQIDKSHWKNIELLSIFTAIITFLFGTVSFMSNGTSITITQQIYNIVAIGVVLLLFVSAISIVTMQRERKHADYWKHPRLYFLLLSIIISVVLIFHILRTVPSTGESFDDSSAFSIPSNTEVNMKGH